jgi:hypothetical protein
MPGTIWASTDYEIKQTDGINSFSRTITDFPGSATWAYDDGWPFPGEHVYPMVVTPDGLLWLIYGSEYPSDDAGLCWYDGVNVGTYPSPPGGIPQYGGLPNSNIKDIEVLETDNGYELWMSCMGRGIAVLTIATDPVSVSERGIIRLNGI